MKKRIMLDLAHTDETAKVTRALSSKIRLNILKLLIHSSYNVSELAEALDKPVSSVANHVRVLEDAGLITTSERPGVRGSQKVCGIAFEGVYFNTFMPPEHPDSQRVHSAMGIGRYFDCEIHGPCGMISEKAYLGTEDSPTVFYTNDRMHAQLLWFEWGYVEYRFPLNLSPETEVQRLVFSFELCSEAPGYNNHWLSDITVSVNDCPCATIRSLGDYGGAPGSLNPSWWPASRTQYGMLHQIELSEDGCHVDGDKVGTLTLADIWQDRPYLSLKLEVREDAEYRGGINLFGERFGNHPQGIHMELQTRRTDGGVEAE